MSSIVESLSRRSQDDVIFHYRDHVVSVKDFSRVATAIRNYYKGSDSKAVELRVVDRDVLPYFLAAFDGYASSMVILHESFADEVVLPESMSGHVRTIVSQKFLDELSYENVDLSWKPTTSTKWLIPTSGTTGVPKVIEHDFDSLTSKLKANAAKGKGIVWGMFYDVTRFAGLQVLLQVIVGGGELVWTDHRTSDKLVEWLSDKKVNAISATPSMWRKLTMNEKFDRLNLKLITMGGEIADASTLDLIANLFPEAKIRHIYASTEAGVGFSVIDKRPGFPVEWLSKALPDGTELKIQDGHLWIRKQKSSQCRQTLGGDSPSSEWMNTEDLVEKRGDRCLFLGRSNGAINVGGLKVQPSEVESILLQHSSVKLVIVRGRPNPIVGNLVVADVVLDHSLVTKQAPHELRQELIDLCKSKLEAHKVPAILKIVDDIPLTDAGKLKR